MRMLPHGVFVMAERLEPLLACLQLSSRFQNAGHVGGRVHGVGGLPACDLGRDPQRRQQQEKNSFSERGRSMTSLSMHALLAYALG